jgi:(1->4)-alpha-D-glucan 1-alpha-D-glucosylmutase
MDGRVKLFVTTAGLQLRRGLPDLFLDGDYLPLDVESAIPASVVAFARTHEDRAALVIAPHLAAALATNGHPPLGDRWATSRVILPPALGDRTYRDAFTGSVVRPASTSAGPCIFVGQALRHLPVSMLIAERS